jgi:signal transduction histidine kinase
VLANPQIDAVIDCGPSGVRTELADGLPTVVGDRVQLQQVVLNLILNARDAMDHVESRPRQLVIGTEHREGDAVTLFVRDSGEGLDAEAHDKLFEAFYTTKPDGMGIGLSVSRSIIERHGGRLWAVPNEGPGSTFSFCIPRCPEPSEELTVKPFPWMVRASVGRSV